MRVPFSSIASLGDIQMLGKKKTSIAVSPYSEYQAMISSFYSTFLVDRSSFIYFCFSAEDPKHFQIILNHLRSKAEGRQSFKNPCVLSCKDRIISQVLLFQKRVQGNGWMVLSIDVQLLAIQKVVRSDSTEKIRTRMRCCSPKTHEICAISSSKLSILDCRNFEKGQKVSKKKLAAAGSILVDELNRWIQIGPQKHIILGAISWGTSTLRPMAVAGSWLSGRSPKCSAFSPQAQAAFF